MCVFVTSKGISPECNVHQFAYPSVMVIAFCQRHTLPQATNFRYYNDKVLLQKVGTLSRPMSSPAITVIGLSEKFLACFSMSSFAIPVLFSIKTERPRADIYIISPTIMHRRLRGRTTWTHVASYQTTVSTL